MKLTTTLCALLASATTPGCTVFDQELPPVSDPTCTTNAECTQRLSGATTTPAVCVPSPTPHCVALTSPDCPTVTGDYLDPRAVVIATLLSVTGAQAATNLPRQQAAMMAVEEINASNASSGILQSTTPGDTRKLAMVSCDEAANFPRAATHLVSELGVAAIVGPNLSQDVLDLTIGKAAVGLPSSAQAGTALLTPTGVASAIATIPDNGLTFMMVPSDIQRVPLMKLQINALETELKAARSKTSLKLAIYYRDDALGEGTRDGLTTLTFNGGSLASAIAGGKAREDAYDPLSTNNAAQVAAYAAFQPDIIVIVGAAEAVRYFLIPLEAAWPAAVPRPYYVAIDSTKVPELIATVTGNDDLRARIRGTGITSTSETLPVLNAFQIAYGQRWKDGNGNPQPATTSGMGPAYDAVYAIALALVGKTTTRGADVAAGMATLATNTAPCAYDASGVRAPCFAVSDNKRTLNDNMGALLAHRDVTEIGTSGRLEWNADGAKSSGVIEMWCITNTNRPSFASAGLTYDVKTQLPSGTYTPCAP